MSALSFFRSLTSVPTAPFFEAAVSAKALALIQTELGRSVKIRRRRGGIIVSYRGAGEGPALAFAAHLDHPAFHLKEVREDGALATLQGGLPPHLLPGAEVEAFAATPGNNEPLARGVLGKPRKDGLYPIRWTAAPKPGARLAFAILRLTPFSKEGGWLLSRSIDDLLGGAASLEALRRLVQAKAKVNVTVLLHRAEEVGFIGALDLIAEGAVSPDDSVISVETSRQMKGARPGRGPVVRLGDRACLFDPNLTALLDEAAAQLKRRGRPIQRLRLTGGACEGTAYLAFGYEAGGVAIPLVNYHNGWGAEKIAPEKVRLEDLNGIVALLVEAAKLFPKATLRGTLRPRLAARLKKAVPLLNFPNRREFGKICR